MTGLYHLTIDGPNTRLIIDPDGEVVGMIWSEGPEEWFHTGSPIDYLTPEDALEAFILVHTGFWDRKG